MVSQHLKREQFSGILVYICQKRKLLKLYSHSKEENILLKLVERADLCGRNVPSNASLLLDKKVYVSYFSV